MKRLAVIILVWTFSAQAIETDKWAHAGVSFAVHTVTGTICDKALRLEANGTACSIMAFIATMAVGVGKELADSQPDPKDLLADAAGASFSFVVREIGKPGPVVKSCTSSPCDDKKDE